MTPATRSGFSAAVKSAVAAPSDSPDDERALRPGGVQHRQGVPDIAAVERGVLGAIRAPGAARIERDHAELARQVRHLGLPQPRVDDRPGRREQDGSGPLPNTS